MDKANPQRPEPGKQAKEPISKKRAGKQSVVCDLGDKLDALGLKIGHVTPDGNCFFRALADQIDGDEDKHHKYRKKVAGYIRKNRENYEPFVEDEVPFDEYCQSMGEDGTWAGNIELQAASLVTCSNICIHRHESPPWYIENFKMNEVQTIHLSYHNGQHYNSVRSKDDTCCGSARPIVVEKDDIDHYERSNQPKAAGMKSKNKAARTVGPEKFINLVKAGSGCKDSREIILALQQVGDDADATVEVLVAEQGSLDLKKDDEREDEHFKQQHEDKTCKLKLGGNDVEIIDKNNNLPPDGKKILRNKMCTCCSEKKYMTCCDSVAGKSSARIPANETVDCGKIRKDRKQGRKGTSTGVTSFIQSKGGSPDMGGLCI